MRATTKTILALLTGMFILPLGACESVWPARHEAEVVSEAPVSIVPKSTIAAERLDNAPGVRAVPQFPPPGDRDLKIMTSKLSGGSVEIYDLDSATNMGAPVTPVTPDYAGIPMASNPSVTVYPIDGYAAYPGEMRAAPNAQPMAQPQWPNSILPVGQMASSGLTPAPNSFGGDQRMAIVDGKLASRAGSDVSNIYFPYGSASLSGADRTLLKDVAETAKFAPVDRVTVEGHASPPTQTNDPVKAKILNLKESMNRATAVSEQLIQKGVPAEKIKTVGWGDTKLSAGNEAEQRRVDIVTGTGAL